MASTWKLARSRMFIISLAHAIAPQLPRGIMTGSSLCATALQRSIRDGQPDFGAAHHRSRIDLDPRSRTPIRSDHEIVVGTVGFAVGPGAVGVHGVGARHSHSAVYRAVYA